ncbi:MAG: ATP synthase F0 subunit B [bacterium]
MTSLSSLASAENLMTSIVFILLVIVFWEVGRSMIKKILQRAAPVFRKPSKSRLQDHEQQVVKAKALKDIKQEASTMISQGHVASLLIKDRILKEAREEAQKILQEARGEIDRIRMEAVETVQKDMVEIVFSFNQYWQKNVKGYTPGSSRVSRMAIEKYLDSYYALKRKPHQTSSLL